MGSEISVITFGPDTHRSRVSEEGTSDNQIFLLQCWKTKWAKTKKEREQTKTKKVYNCLKTGSKTGRKMVPKLEPIWSRIRTFHKISVA